MTILCTCSRPLSSARKIADGVGRCECGRQWARITMDEWRMAEQIDHWNRAMRNAKSRRKFVLTGRV